MNEKKYVAGALNLLETLDLSEESRVLVISSESKTEMALYILEALKEKEIKDVLYTVLPKIFRPITALPTPLKGAAMNSDAVVYLVNRISEENFTFNRPLQQVCVENRTKYVYLYDPKDEYFIQGIAANNQAVRNKALRIKELLEKTASLRVTSKLGTNLTFSLYTHNIMPRSPIFNEGFYWNQSPEGEVMSCPKETSFNGTMVIDGVATGMGEPSRPIRWEFKDGVVTDVSGDESYLEQLLELLVKSDQRVNSFKGMWIAELSIGCNDWAVFDDNISNCEKVSGGVHFAMGNSEGLGVDRGETYHFDNIMKTPSISLLLDNGKEIRLIEEGQLLI